MRNLDEVWLEITLARRLQGRAPAKTTPHPVPTRHQSAVAALDYTHNFSSLPKHILFFFPSTKHIKHSTKTPPNTPNQPFTMATLSCTYSSSPLARWPCPRELCVCCDLLATALPRVHHSSTTIITLSSLTRAPSRPPSRQALRGRPRHCLQPRHLPCCARPRLR